MLKRFYFVGIEFPGVGGTIDKYRCGACVGNTPCCGDKGVGCFSFYPGKNLYAFGEGGSVTCHKKEYFDAITTIKNQGCKVRYYHDVIGYNYRLEEVLAKGCAR